jgi:AbrB family looped-hinge helix DNA binding protein
MQKKQTCCEEPVSKVESVLTVDERGQMVLPKNLRGRAGINAGDKLAVVSHSREGQVCCITLIKADSLTDMVRGLLGPMMKDIITL